MSHTACEAGSEPCSSVHRDQIIMDLRNEKYGARTQGLRLTTNNKAITYYQRHLDGHLLTSEAFALLLRLALNLSPGQTLPAPELAFAY